MYQLLKRTLKSVKRKKKEKKLFVSNTDRRDRREQSSRFLAFLNEAPVINRPPQICPPFLFNRDGRHFWRGGTTPAGQIFQKDIPRYSHASIQAYDINNRINNRRNRRSAAASGKKLMRAGFVARVLEPSTNDLRLGFPLLLSFPRG